MNDVLNLALLAVAGYAIYEMLSSLPSGVSTNAPTANGPLNAAMDAIYPNSFPGGGEAPGSAETYTGALSETVMHPVDTAETILGFNQTKSCVPLYFGDLMTLIGIVP